MGIAIRFLSGSLQGRVFEFDKDAIRVGDAPDVDVRVNPDEPDNGGARDRIVEVMREGDLYRVHSTGSREVSAQGDTAIDRRVPVGEEIRFGAWGPIFMVIATATQRTAPIPVVSAGDDSATRRKKLETTGPLKTVSGDRPVGQKTVYMMIQEALGKARESEGLLSQGTTFIRQIVTESMQTATRSFKLGLLLLGAALLVLAGVLVYNITATKQTLTEVSRTADRRVADVKNELSGELTDLKKGRADLAKEADELTARLQELEKSKQADQKAVADLRARLRDAEARRKDLEARMSAAMSALEAERQRLAAEQSRLERERQEAQRRADEAAKAEAAARAQEAGRADAPPPQAIATPQGQ